MIVCLVYLPHSQSGPQPGVGGPMAVGRIVIQAGREERAWNQPCIILFLSFSPSSSDFKSLISQEDSEDRYLAPWCPARNL